jgi:hypothetical protein
LPRPLFGCRCAFLGSIHPFPGPFHAFPGSLYAFLGPSCPGPSRWSARSTGRTGRPTRRPGRSANTPGRPARPAGGTFDLTRRSFGPPETPTTRGRRFFFFIGRLCPFLVVRRLPTLLLCSALGAEVDLFIGQLLAAVRTELGGLLGELRAALGAKVCSFIGKLRAAVRARWLSLVLFFLVMLLGHRALLPCSSLGGYLSQGVYTHEGGD